MAFAGWSFVGCIYTGLIVLGFVLNIIAILTFKKNRRLLTVSDLPILSIAISDLVLAIFVMPIGAATHFQGERPFGTSGCSYYACANTIIGLAAILHHAVIALEKGWHTHRPMSTALTQKQMLKIIVFLWVFSALWGIFPLVGWSAYVEEGAICSIQWRSDELVHSMYVICVFIIFFLFPAVFIVVSYAIIYNNLRQMEERAKRQCGITAQQAVEIVLGKKKVFSTAFIIIAGFFVVWTPYAIVSFYMAFGEAEHTPPLALIIPPIFAKACVFLNPIIYFIRYKRFRQGVKKLLKGIISFNNSVSTGVA